MLGNYKTNGNTPSIIIRTGLDAGVYQRYAVSDDCKKLLQKIGKSFTKGAVTSPATTKPTTPKNADNNVAELYT